MGDIKIFRYDTEGATELRGSFALQEKDLHALIEKNLECFLGCRLIAREHGTGREMRGCIDTLALDENNCPVIIEYKRRNNENVITQGLYYMDWLMSHQADFHLLTRERLGWEMADKVDFAGTRLICVASGFSRFDENAIRQIDRYIELVRYRYYGEDLLVLERLNTAVAVFTPERALGGEGNGEENMGVGMPPNLRLHIQNMSPETEAIYLELLAFAENLGEDVSIRFLKHYVALSRLKNFTCIEPRRQGLKLWLSLDPARIPLEEGFSRDATAIGHRPTGNLEIDLRAADDLVKAKPLIELAYQQN